MILIGCQSDKTMIPCETCKLNGFPHRCNVFRDENGMEKVTQLEWIQTPESSNIEMFAFEEAVLSVCFKNGTFYDYFDVPQRIYEDMKTAESKGKFLNSTLKGKYKWVKVE